MDVSLSSDSASLAATHSSRSRVIAERTAGSAWSSAGQRVAEGGADVREHGLVEVDATEALDALRLAERLEAVAGAPQHGGVERAAAEVVDRDDVAHVDALTGGEVHGGRLRLGDERRASGSAGELRRLLRAARSCTDPSSPGGRWRPATAARPGAR